MAVGLDLVWRPLWSREQRHRTTTECQSSVPTRALIMLAAPPLHSRVERPEHITGTGCMLVLLAGEEALKLIGACCTDVCEGEVSPCA